ncbi:protein-disulfide reductase DsbD [Halomonas sp. 18H]|nr:protein-disulfide reductase DsbD [Halomonas sp. 18H]MCW4151073.1 protein-disulfide reductase DsbD [Halomonas sp. 18H]
MKPLRLLGLLWLLLLTSPVTADWFSSSDSSNFLPVEEAFQPAAWHDGETLRIGFESAEGYYLYRHRFTVGSATDGINLGEPALPPGEARTDEFLGEVQVFHDRMMFAVPLRQGHEGPLDIALTYQGCAEAGLCYPPETITLEAPQGQAPAAFAGMSATSSTSASPDAAEETAAPDSSTLRSEDGRFSALMRDASLPLVLGLFFLAGLGLTFTPCVLPMVPILSAIIVGQNPGRPRALALSASYVAGMASTYALVGVLMGLFGAGLNLQARLQSPPVLIGFAILFVLFALAMFGTFDLRLSSGLTQRLDAWQDRARRSGPAGLALAGALSVLVVSPCVSAPLAGALVFISSTGDALMGGAALLALALGMGVPLLLVGTFGVTLLPRSGGWMNGVKHGFGILLLGVAIWLIERLLAGPLVLMLWAALACGTALTLGALSPGLPQGWPRVRQAAGILLLVWAVVLVIGASRGSDDPLQPLAPTQTQRGGPEAGARPHQSVTEVKSLDELRDALAAGEAPAMVNVTAEWCISCQVMKREVFTDHRVQRALAPFRRIDVDVTESNPASRRLLDHFDLFGPPSLLFFDDGEEIRAARIQGQASSEQLARQLDDVMTRLTQPSATATAFHGEK